MKVHPGFEMSEVMDVTQKLSTVSEISNLPSNVRSDSMEISQIPSDLLSNEIKTKTSSGCKR